MKNLLFFFILIHRSIRILEKLIGIKGSPLKKFNPYTGRALIYCFVSISA